MLACVLTYLSMRVFLIILLGFCFGSGIPKFKHEIGFWPRGRFVFSCVVEWNFSSQIVRCLSSKRVCECVDMWICVGSFYVVKHSSFNRLFEI